MQKLFGFELFLGTALDGFARDFELTMELGAVIPCDLWRMTSLSTTDDYRQLIWLIIVLIRYGIRITTILFSDNL